MKWKVGFQYNLEYGVLVVTFQNSGIYKSADTKVEF